MEITPGLVEEFKDRMHISHGGEDDNLERHLRNSAAAIKRMVGDVDIEQNFEARELVIERARYAYNDSLEFFEDNFLGQLTSLGLSILPVAEGDSDG